MGGSEVQGHPQMYKFPRLTWADPASEEKSEGEGPCNAWNTHSINSVKLLMLREVVLNL